MGNCSVKSHQSSEENSSAAEQAVNPPPSSSPSTSFHKKRQSRRWSRKSFVSAHTGKSDIRLELPDPDNDSTTRKLSMDLLDSLLATALLLATKAEEASLTKEEITAALQVYHELQRVLSTATRTGDWMARPSNFSRETPFRTRYEALLEEFDEAEDNVQKTLSHPAAVRPISTEALLEVKDFFILDNSLRETTVGAARGHTLQEKRDIVKSMAETGLEEVILGSFGSKIAVDSQIAQEWQRLGKTFDSSWGFSDGYDLEAYDEEPLWHSIPDFIEREGKGERVSYYTPPAIPKTTYSKEDVELFHEASKGFRENAFGGMKLKKILKQSESPMGRVPLGLLMMAGYGICNAIIEIDTAVETFDYETYDIVERCRFLINWCKTYLPRRNVPQGQDDAPRVLFNLRDFSNYNRSKGGMENTLQLVDSLSHLAPSQRPFGFMMEEPTGWLFPREVGRLVRMIRLTMERAGFPEGRFLVHLHMYFGLAEATQLAALCNGADGVWAAVCKAGAQVGHACSTMTAVNLFRAGHHDICKRYDLEKMCQAAREITAISTRQPCPTHEEVYGEAAFDIPYFMVNVPACRYSLAMLLKEMGVERTVRLNEISAVSAVQVARSITLVLPTRRVGIQSTAKRCGTPFTIIC